MVHVIEYTIRTYSMDYSNFNPFPKFYVFPARV